MANASSSTMPDSAPFIVKPPASTTSPPASEPQEIARLNSAIYSEEATSTTSGAALSIHAISATETPP